MLAMGSEMRPIAGRQQQCLRAGQRHKLDELGGGGCGAGGFRTAHLIALRKAHPAFTRDHFLTGAAADVSLIPDVQWLTSQGLPMQPEDWGNGDLHTVIAALYAPAGENHEADRVIAILHAGPAPIEVTLPEAQTGCVWRCCVDTSREDDSGEGRSLRGATKITVAPRSVAILEERSGGQISLRNQIDKRRCARSARQACRRCRDRGGLARYCGQPARRALRDEDRVA